MYYCANSTGLDWILQLGDSQEREFMAQLKMWGVTTPSPSKFPHFSSVMDQSPNNLTLTWQFYSESLLPYGAQGGMSVSSAAPRQFSTDQKLLDHFNVRASQVMHPDVPATISCYCLDECSCAQASGAPILHPLYPHLNHTETRRPSVVLLNHAAAYAAWWQVVICVSATKTVFSLCVTCLSGLQTTENHKEWMADLAAYIKDAESPAVIPGRPELLKPTRIIWFGASYIFGPAHAGSEHVTVFRHQSLEKHSQRVMRSLGVPIIDAGAITQSRLEDAYDGLHYLKQVGENDWVGCTAAMTMQVALNVIFPHCIGLGL